ncbi:hypothetical protein [Mesorhizobium sp.]|uniref:hypothetical protein n=1 Tax=Mesorhizobium sp. TaxID=1871066 RepID=UPI000FEA052F|nr:hypothetical protein [Mesorhizobium sp.]RWP62135.1 MAG: hypothetical protein EOR08_15505 [Mesorhizobium sp.]
MDAESISSKEEFVRLLEEDGTWANFEADWQAQCDKYEEDFEGYAEATFSVIRDLIRTEKKKAGVFALKMNGSFVAMCQVNKAGLPKYDSPVLRVRFMTLSPEFDLADKSFHEYGDVLSSLLAAVLELAYWNEELACMHVKFHLRSQADQQFFATLGKGLQDGNYFESIKTRGAWLYITRKQRNLVEV